METDTTYWLESMCPKCGKQKFEVAALLLANTKYVPWVIKCFDCHTVISVVPIVELEKIIKITV
jgi:hypothetical protein